MENGSVHEVFGGWEMGRLGAYLAEALKVNSSLSALWLESNQIGDAGSSALANILKVNRSLSTLLIEWGKLSDDIKILLLRNKQFAPQLAQANQSCRDGQAHLAAQRCPEARQCFERALQIYPEHQGAQAGLNKTKLEQVRSTHLELYDTIVRLEQNDPTLTELNLYGHLQQDDPSLAKLNVYSQKSRDGQAHLAAQRYPEARQCFESALKIYPELLAVQAGLNKTERELIRSTHLELHDAIARLPQNDPSRALLNLDGHLRQNDPTRTTLNLYGQEIGDKEASLLATALAKNTTLSALYLHSNQIGYIGAMALADALKTNSSLSALALRGDHIGDTGAKALADALTVNSSLSALFLEKNQIGDAGASALADALKVNASLSRLYLDHNQIRNAGASALADALKVNSSLSLLDLRFNKIGETGARALTEMRKVNLFGSDSPPLAA